MEMKAKIEDYKQNYLKKEYFLKMIEKIQEAFVNVDMDTSSLKELVNIFNNPHGASPKAQHIIFT